MTPFYDWSMAKRGGQSDWMEDQSDVLTSETHQLIFEELAELSESIVLNLMTASVVQSRSRLEQFCKEFTKQKSEQNEQILQAKIEAMEGRILEAVADVLLPVVGKMLLNDALEGFSTTLRKLLPEFGTRDLVVKAPTELHTMLSLVLRNHDLEVEIQENNSPSVSIAGNHIVISTDLQAWSETLPGLKAA